MPPKRELSTDQVTMLVEVVKRSQANLTIADWGEISDHIGAANVKAA